MGVDKMTHFSDPEKPNIEDAKKREMDRVWKKGLIGDVTYLRSLFLLGYLSDEANTELNLLKLDGKQRDIRLG
jgi:hypothetical protein